MKSITKRRFNRFSLFTLVAVYILIFVGGVVRSTGSGMGCPDWPTCFGKIIPPTSKDELPINYKEIYSNYRLDKNEKFASYLIAVGLRSTAEKVLNDPSIIDEQDFNAAKTWIEYFNRLVGSIIGILIVILFYRSIRFRRDLPSLFWVSLVTLVTVIIQGWFGSIVVSTNLTQWTITVHMFIALLIVGFLIYIYHRSGYITQKGKVSGSLLVLLLISFIILLVQLFLGTEVREGIDQIAGGVARNRWIDMLGAGFLVHRSFSLGILALNAFLVMALLKSTFEKSLSRLLIVLILGAILSGAGMAYFNVPPFLQPIHLVIATILFGAHFLLVLRVLDGRRV